MEVSVVIPVYNKVEYVERCLRSVLAQEMDGFEVIAVDDGSTDGSGAVCDRLAAEDARLRVIHTPNGGVTAARRRGVEEARGRYITFADADDAMLPGGLRSLCEAIGREQADEVVATYRNQHGLHVDSGLRGVVSTRFMINQLLGSKARFCVLWGVIFRRELLDGCLTAPRQIRAGEDILMQVMCLVKRPKVVFIPDCVYLYTEGLPNDRRLELGEQMVYDSVLRRVLAPCWAEHSDDFTLRQLKMYENFIDQKMFYVRKEYYHQMRPRLNARLPLADRIAFLLPPRLAYMLVSLRKGQPGLVRVLSRLQGSAGTAR